MTEYQLKQIADIINKHKRFIITTHSVPDGDGLGSEIGLKYFLEKLNKEVIIINPDLTSERYAFIDPNREIMLYAEAKESIQFEDYEVLIVLDTCSFNRIGEVGNLKNFSHLKFVSLDHHETEGDLPGLNLINKKASAIGEMIFDLIKYYKISIDKKIATPLYISIVSDTGSFSYSNTTGKSHNIAGQLLDCGVDPSAIRGAIFETNKLNQILLLGECLKSIKSEYKGRILWMSASKDQFDKYGLTHNDVYFFIDILKTIGRAELIAFFKEVQPGEIEVSMRSRNREMDVAKIAETLGGGGHRAASGFTFEGNLADTIQTTLDLFLREIKNRKTLRLELSRKISSD